MSQERPDERFAFAVVARVLAATVEPYDVRGRQGAIDAILHHPDGRTAALEVSSIGPDDEAGIINYLAARGHCKSLAGVTRKWLIQVPRNFHPADMRKIDKVLPQCEASGVENLSELAGKVKKSTSCSVRGFVPAVLLVRQTPPDRESTSCYPG